MVGRESGGHPDKRLMLGTESRMNETGKDIGMAGRRGWETILEGLRKALWQREEKVAGKLCGRGARKCHVE